MIGLQVVAALVWYAAAAPTTAEPEFRLQVKAFVPAAGGRVRVTFLEGPKALRDRGVQEMELPFDMVVPSQTVRVQIEPVNRALKTTTVAEFWWGIPLVQGTVTGIGADVQLYERSLVMRTAGPASGVRPLEPQP
jgi:hypothetical protein